MLCPACQTETRRFGKDRHGNQRWQCTPCRKTITDIPTRTLGRMRITLEKALACLQLLVEGMSVRATMRVTGVNRNTILDLLVMIGERCEKMMAGRITNVPVVDVQCDEIWGFVHCKEKVRARRYADEAEIGDAYCYVAMERETKVVLAWHVGRRDAVETAEFARKLAEATTGRFQVNTDGYKPYKTAIPAAFPQGVDFAQLVKVYATKDDHKYSPGEVTGTIKTPCCGNPNEDNICTSHVERQNLTIRMSNRRMTRLTNAFSKKWANHKAALALHFAYYNFCRKHTTLKMTPAMAAGFTDHPWTLVELLEQTQA